MKPSLEGVLYTEKLHFDSKISMTGQYLHHFLCFLIGIHPKITNANVL